MLIDKVATRIKKENSDFFWIGNSRDLKKIYYKEIIYIKKSKALNMRSMLRWMECIQQDYL